MNAQRLAIVGVVVAIALAIFAFIQQQQAANDASIAATNQANAEATRDAAIAAANAAATAQAEAEAAQATAEAQARDAATAQAEAEAAQATAEAEAAEAATAQAEAEDAQATAEAQARDAATAQATAEEAAATSAAQADAQATAQAAAESAQAEAEAQAEQAAAAQAAAESSQATAVAQAEARATAQSEAEASAALAATAQAAAEANAEQADAAAAAAIAGQQNAQATLDVALSQLATAQANLLIVSAQATAVAGLQPPGGQPPAGQPTLVPTTEPSGDAPGLTQRYTSQNGRITVSLPADWVAFDLQSGLVGFFNQRPPSNLGERIPSGLLGGVVNVLSDQFTTQIGDLPLEVVVLGIAEVLTNEVSGGRVTYGLPDSVILSDGSAAASVVGSNRNADYQVILFKRGTNYAYLFAFTAPDEIGPYNDTLLAIAGSVEFRP